MADQFIVREGSLQEKFLNSRNKIQFYGGGYGNGKTSCACIKAIQLMKDYPNSYGAVLRSTLPKLVGSTMKEFFKWLPENWIKSFNKQSRILELKNGSKCLFTYLGQKGSGDNKTSNVLSSTFDWAMVDQFEDPEFTYKDFTDLLGRLRGSAKYNGDDKTMPLTGPRWLFFLTNPTRNWVYRKIVQPVHAFKESGRISEDLLIDDKNGELLIDIIEGSTYENKDNLPVDFIQTLEATYKGQMRDRFLNGEWAAYEGLVYPDYNSAYHLVSERDMNDYLDELSKNNNVEFVEAFDYGSAVPSCYLLGFTDNNGLVHIIDGFHKERMRMTEIADNIKRLRQKYGVGSRNLMLIDPALFRKATTESQSISDQFYDLGINTTKADNNIVNGIAKVTNYLSFRETIKNPYTGCWNAPSIYFNEKLMFIDKEFTDYNYKKSTDDNYTDLPNDVNDHAMDTIKYLLTRHPEKATVRITEKDKFAKLYEWRESDD